MSDVIQPRAGMAKTKRLKRRYREELRFRAYGVAAIGFAIISLCVLLVSIVREAVSAFSRYDLSIDLYLDPAVVDPSGERLPEDLRSNVSGFSELIRTELSERFPDASKDRDLKRQLTRLVSTLSAEEVASQVAETPSLIGSRLRVSVPLSDRIDLYLKGLVTDQQVWPGQTEAVLSGAADAIRIEARGGFAEAYASLAGRLSAEAAQRREVVRSTEASIARMDGLVAGLRGEREAVSAMQAMELKASGRALVDASDEGLLDLALLAGRASASGDFAALRAALATELKDRAVEARGEADELLNRAEGFRRKAISAESRGESNAETRRIQARTAYLAGDRRHVDAERFDSIARSIGSMGPEELLATVSLLSSRPLAPLGRLVGLTDPADLRPAVIKVNQAEVESAAAAVDDQVARVRALEAKIAAMRATLPDRADSLEEEGLAAAKSKLRRLERDLSVLEATAQKLTAPEVRSPEEIVAAPGDVPGALQDSAAVAAAPAPDLSEFVFLEAKAQLGLDLGGSFSVAYALGRLDGGADGAEAELRALLVGRVDRDLEKADADRARLIRKREKDLKAAGDLETAANNPSIGIDLDTYAPTVLVDIDGGVIKARKITHDVLVGQALLPLRGSATVSSGAWSVRELSVPEADRLVTDHQIVWADHMLGRGDIVRRPNMTLLTHADSTYPELAGLAAGLAGSFWIMLVTLVLSLPVGVMAAIYLEEFAPRNWVTDFIEVNINNLAAVPSIVFGLLGAAVFINFFDLPRSSPLVGGLVLSLITLPTIIIATRAALGAVPPSIREGALAVGASLPQTVFHHVLPLAAPGILTGAIIGLARALGETAPLLLIGMVAFVADPPESMLDSATALPVLVYKWSSGAERAWQPMTSAAIIVLLVFMFAMNALAVYLRRRLERRW